MTSSLTPSILDTDNTGSRGIFNFEKTIAQGEAYHGASEKSDRKTESVVLEVL